MPEQKTSDQKSVQKPISELYFAKNRAQIINMKERVQKGTTCLTCPQAFSNFEESYNIL